MNDRFDELRQQYGCGPVRFSGADEALYNRHLLFDAVIDPFRATPREQFEAMARSLRERSATMEHGNGSRRSIAARNDVRPAAEIPTESRPFADDSARGCL